MMGLLAEHLANRPALIGAADDLAQQVRHRQDHQAVAEKVRHLCGDRDGVGGDEFLDRQFEPVSWLPSSVSAACTKTM